MSGRFYRQKHFLHPLPNKLELFLLCSGNCCFGALIFTNMIALIPDCFSDTNRRNGSVWPVFTQEVFAWCYKAFFVVVLKPGKVSDSMAPDCLLQGVMYLFVFWNLTANDLILWVFFLVFPYLFCIVKMNNSVNINI